MRGLIPPAGFAGALADLDDTDLSRWYQPPARSWLRANMVSTLDGAASGADGLSGSINNAADHRVFALLRATSEVVVVGAGTARAEGYRAAEVPLCVVSRSGTMPQALLDPPGLLLTRAAAPGLAAATDLLGAERVLVLGHDEVDLTRLRPALAERGFRRVLCEGGPSLLGALLSAAVIDELDLTMVPHLGGGDAGRITAGPPLGVPARLHALLEDDATLLGRWLLG